MNKNETEIILEDEYAPRPRRRHSGLSADSLRERVLDAIPVWETWPRLLRQAYVLLPTHGATQYGLESIAETLGVSAEKLNELIENIPSFKDHLLAFVAKGHYPEQKTPQTRRYKTDTPGLYKEKYYPRGPLPHSWLVEHLANELSVSAVVQLERSGMKVAGTPHKLAEKAGWFAGQEYEAERTRASLARRLRRQEESIERNRTGRPIQTSTLPEFEQDIDPEDLAADEDEDELESAEYDDDSAEDETQ